MPIGASPWIRAAAALLVGVTLHAADGARADTLPDRALRDARRALATYDTIGSDTTDVLTDLSRYLQGAQGANAREARFLRAVAASDLVLVAHGQRREELRRRVAEALGVPEAELVGWLREQLAMLRYGVYADVAGQCDWALRAVEATDIDPRFLREGRGERRDVLYVHAVVDALGLGDDLGRLAAFGADPCAGGEACDVAGFSESGRRAVEALQEANRALSRLEAIEATGEPLTSSLAAIVTADGAVLRSSTIRPTPRWPDALRVHGVGARGHEAQPDVLIVVAPDAIHYTHVPSVRIIGDAVRRVSSVQPALPAWGRIAFSEDGRAVVAHYDALIEPFERLLRDAPGDRVALAAQAEVPSLVVSRVILSMLRAGFEAPELASRGLHGEVRSVPVELIMGEERRPPLSLFVRMGGYTLTQPGQRMQDIPRIRDSSGLRFDLATLERSARRAGSVAASLRYMGVVEWGVVLDAAYHLDTESGPLGLVLY